jgi:dehydrogenase/reductase SDR family protein 12
LKLLELLVGSNPVTSYTRIGFAVRRAAFDPADLDVDLTGRTAVITGASSGLGLIVTRELARRGARVFMLCRDPAKGAAVADRVRADAPAARLDVLELDVARPQAVRSVAKKLNEVDILVQNAAVLPAAREMTPEGLERTLATNLVGAYLLTELLRDKLATSADARLVFVSSGGMYPRRLDVASLHHDQGSFDGVTAYADTKRAMVELAEHYAEVLPANVTVSSMHPGWAETPGVERSLPLFHKLTRLILRSAEEGADTVVWLAASPRAKGRTGLFWLDREPRATHVFPWTRTPPGERAKLVERLAEWAK